MQDYDAEADRKIREWTGIHEYQVVRDSIQFQKALCGGAVHMEIQSHLDLTAIEGLTEDGLKTLGYEEGVYLSFFPPSIQVRFPSISTRHWHCILARGYVFRACFMYCSSTKYFSTLKYDPVPAARTNAPDSPKTLRRKKNLYLERVRYTGKLHGSTSSIVH